MTQDTAPIEAQPISMSESGLNSHTFWCDQLDRRTHYAACLHTLGRFDTGDTDDERFTECATADRCGRCPARAMRKEETVAGKALYFTKRRVVEAVDRPKRVETEDDVRQVDRTSPSYLRGRYGVNSPEYRASVGMSTPNPTPKPKPKSEVMEFDAGKIVSEIAVEEAKIKPEKTVAAPIKPLPGESPLEFAKRRKQAMKEVA